MAERLMIITIARFVSEFWKGFLYTCNSLTLLVAKIVQLTGLQSNSTSILYFCLAIEANRQPVFRQHRQFSYPDFIASSTRNSALKIQCAFLPVPECTRRLAELLWTVPFDRASYISYMLFIDHRISIINKNSKKSQNINLQWFQSCFPIIACKGSSKIIVPNSSFLFFQTAAWKAFCSFFPHFFFCFHSMEMKWGKAKSRSYNNAIFTKNGPKNLLLHKRDKPLFWLDLTYLQHFVCEEKQ